MNQSAGFVILLFAALLLIVSSGTGVKVTAQGNGSSSEKSTMAAKTCSPELFKEQPGLCAALYALAHNKESSTSAEKPAETGTIISAPIEIKKGPTMEENSASAPLTGELAIKKPATSSNPVSQNCLKTETRSGESLCLTTPYAYQAGWHGAQAGQNSYEACAGNEVIKIPNELLKSCIAGWQAYKDSAPVNNGEKAVPVQNCKGPAGTNNGIGSAYTNCLKP
jgi:hypothetical protein